jgi:hypothetical protein
MHDAYPFGPTSGVRATMIAACIGSMPPAPTFFCCPDAGLKQSGLEHDPKKWTPVFGKDHARTTG